jgi:predicted small secreted protein
MLGEHALLRSVRLADAVQDAAGLVRLEAEDLERPFAEPSRATPQPNNLPWLKSRFGHSPYPREPSLDAMAAKRGEQSVRRNGLKGCGTRHRRQEMIRTAIAAAMIAATMMALGGCANTMRGVGTDVQRNTDAAVKATVPRHR